MKWAEAVSHVNEGGLLVYPTDTVWGLGCRADRKDWVASCLAAKGPQRNPVCSVICHPDFVSRIVDCSEVNLSEFLPGAFTLILPLKDQRFSHVASEDGFLGVRIPDLPELLEFVKKVGKPFITTSANKTGTPPCTDAHQAKAFAQDIGAAWIAHDQVSGQPSTILKWHQGTWQKLR